MDSRRDRLHLVARLARKELRETLRDRRTMVTLVLMPVLLYPLLGMAFQQYFLSTVIGTTTVKEYHIAIATDAEEDLLPRLMEHRPDDPELKRVITDDPKESVRLGDADVAVRIRARVPGDGFECEILFREDSAMGVAAADHLRERLSQANLRILLRQLKALGEPNPAIPISLSVATVAAAEGKKSSLLASLIPLILVLMTITGAVYPAIDLTAGERERGTLEILMAAPIPRLALLLAKYTAVLTVAVVTGVINLGMMTVTLVASPLGASVFGDGGLNAGTVAAVFFLLLLFAMFFSAVLLAVTSIARTFKEAQSYLIPLMLVSISPGMLALDQSLRLGGLLTVMPLINVVLLGKEILSGGAPLNQAAMVVASTMLYALVAIGVAARLFGAEAVLYSDQSHWGDLLRRPRQARSRPTLTAALACLAVAFPMSLLVGDTLARFQTSQELQLVLSIVASITLFAGIPVLSAWLSHVRFASGFQIRRPSLLVVAGAIVLGLSLWPGIAELIALERRVGFFTMPEWLREKIAELTAQRRDMSPVLVLLALAIVPAAVEEFLFRGYLYNALLSTGRVRTAVVGSALLFGLFHVFTGGILTIERFLPTALLGLVLAGLRWRSDSILPGIALHALHNGLIIGISLFPKFFGQIAEVSASSQYVPMTWLGASAVGIALGAGLVYFAPVPMPLTSDDPKRDVVEANQPAVSGDPTDESGNHLVSRS